MSCRYNLAKRHNEMRLRKQNKAVPTESFFLTEGGADEGKMTTSLSVFSKNTPLVFEVPPSLPCSIVERMVPEPSRSNVAKLNSNERLTIDTGVDDDKKEHDYKINKENINENVKINANEYQNENRSRKKGSGMEMLERQAKWLRAKQEKETIARAQCESKVLKCLSFFPDIKKSKTSWDMAKKTHGLELKRLKEMELMRQISAEPREVVHNKVLQKKLSDVGDICMNTTSSSNSTSLSLGTPTDAVISTSSSSTAPISSSCTNSMYAKSNTKIIPVAIQPTISEVATKMKKVKKIKFKSKSKSKSRDKDNEMDSYNNKTERDVFLRTKSAGTIQMTGPSRSDDDCKSGCNFHVKKPVVITTGSTGVIRSTIQKQTQTCARRPYVFHPTEPRRPKSARNALTRMADAAASEPLSRSVLAVALEDESNMANPIPSISPYELTSQKQNTSVAVGSSLENMPAWLKGALKEMQREEEEKAICAAAREREKKLQEQQRVWEQEILEKQQLEEKDEKKEMRNDITISDTNDSKVLTNDIHNNKTDKDDRQTEYNDDKANDEENIAILANNDNDGSKLDIKEHKNQLENQDIIPMEMENINFFDINSTNTKGRHRVHDAREFVASSLHRISPENGITLLIGEMKKNGQKCCLSVLFDRKIFKESDAMSWWFHHKKNYI
jgi:hypothetical protein